MNIDDIKKFEAKLIALEENINKLAESIKDPIDNNCTYEGFETTLTLYQLSYNDIKKNYEAACQQDNNSGKIEVLYANDPDDLVEKELIIASALAQLLQQFNITSNALLIAGLNLKKCLFASKELLNAGQPISCATNYTPQIEPITYQPSLSEEKCGTTIKERVLAFFKSKKTNPIQEIDLKELTFKKRLTE